MNRYRVLFAGVRGDGMTTGLASRFEVDVVARDMEDARTVLYDEYSHITTVCRTLLKQDVDEPRGIKA